MTRTLVALAAVAAVAGSVGGSVPAHAERPLPVKLVAEPGSCPPGYDDIGYVGPEGARWRICWGPIDAP